MKLFTKRNNKAIIQCETPVAHTIDDVAENVLTEPALLYVGTMGNIKVKSASGDVFIIPNYFNQVSILVLKVYDTDTDIESDQIKLFR